MKIKFCFFILIFCLLIQVFNNQAIPKDNPKAECEGGEVVCPNGNTPCCPKEGLTLRCNENDKPRCCEQLDNGSWKCKRNNGKPFAVRCNNQCGDNNNEDDDVSEEDTTESEGDEDISSSNNAESDLNTDSDSNSDTTTTKSTTNNNLPDQSDSEIVKAAAIAAIQGQRIRNVMPPVVPNVPNNVNLGDLLPGNILLANQVYCDAVGGSHCFYEGSNKSPICINDQRETSYCAAVFAGPNPNTPSLPAQNLGCIFCGCCNAFGSAACMSLLDAYANNEEPSAFDIATYEMHCNKQEALCSLVIPNNAINCAQPGDPVCGQQKTCCPLDAQGNFGKCLELCGGDRCCPPNVCINNRCEPRRAGAAPCNEDKECTSDICFNGSCAITGTSRCNETEVCPPGSFCCGDHCCNQGDVCNPETKVCEFRQQNTVTTPPPNTPSPSAPAAPAPALPPASPPSAPVAPAPALLPASPPPAPVAPAPALPPASPPPAPVAPAPALPPASPPPAPVAPAPALPSPAFIPPSAPAAPAPALPSPAFIPPSTPAAPALPSPAFIPPSAPAAPALPSPAFIPPSAPAAPAVAPALPRQNQP